MKYNKKVSESEKLEGHPQATRNYEGGLAFKPTPKTELTLRFLTFLVNEPKFYTTGAQDTSEIAALIAEVATFDPEYILKLAAYARNEMYLRSAPIFALIEAAGYNAAKPFIRSYVPHIIKRADELAETVAAFINKHGEIGSNGKASIPNSLKKGIADAFLNFDEYQFAKYNRPGEVKLKDVLRLVHPNPRTQERAELFRRILDDTLAIPETWETYISVHGSTKENWEHIAPKMPYMAKLRNLRNMLKVDVDDNTIEAIASHISSPVAVKNSKQYPFRFLSAHRELEKAEGDEFKKEKLLNAVKIAIELSCTNLPELPGRTFITADNSGSMTSPVSSRSDVSLRDIANTMAALTTKMCDESIVSVFADQFAVVPVSKQDSVMTNLEKIIYCGQHVGGGTDAWITMEYLLNNKISVDRIFILSDMQCYDTGSYGGWQDRSLAEKFRLYKRTINPNVRLYSWNISGYETIQFPENEPGVVLMSGWSDKALEFIHQYENFGDEFIGKIENYSPMTTPSSKEVEEKVKEE